MDRARPAAAYMRMSTEHQRYSIEHQTGVIAAYAVEKGYALVRTYVDAGKSGVHIAGRAALSELLRDVVGGAPDFEVILVLDVSRWGRFQDPDEGAHYEFICRTAGVAVEYCSEAFANDGSLLSSLVKQLKRTMAAEYSRELSVKISTVQRGLAAQGFWMCGPPGYGLRRLVIDERGRPAGILEPGERKAVQGRRITLIPGPPEEIATVRRVYRLYVSARMTHRAIARRLNAEGVAFTGGRPWTAQTVAGLLSNPKYVGDLVYGRTAKRLGRRSLPVPPEQWVSRRDAFEALVDRRSFGRAQARRSRRQVAMDREQMLKALRELWRREGYLSARIIKNAKDMPCVTIYSREFGGLKGAYNEIGYDHVYALRHRCGSMSDADALTRLRALLVRRGYLAAHIIDATSGLPGADSYRERFGDLHAAYRLVGYEPAGAGPYRPRRDLRYSKVGMLEGLRRLLTEKGLLTTSLVGADPRLAGTATIERRFGSMVAAFEQAGYVAPRSKGAARNAAQRAGAAGRRQPRPAKPPRGA